MLTRIIIVVISLIFVTGCWDRVEINDKNFIIGLAFDKGSDKTYRVTVQWALPEQTKSTGRSNYTIEGNSIYEIRNQIMEMSPRNPVFSHTKIIIIGKDLAMEGIKELAHDIGRDLQIRRSTYMLVADKNASDIIRTPTLFERTATDLDEILRMRNNSSTFLKINFNTFMMDFIVDNQTALIPMVTLASLTNNEETNRESNKIPKIRGMAIFRQGEMIWELTGEMTKDWIYIKGDISNGTSTQWTFDSRNLITETVSQSTRMKIKNNNRIEVDVRVKETSIINRPNLGGELTNAETQQLEKQIEDAIKKRVKKLIRQSQDKKIDIFNIGKKMHRYQPRMWRKYKDKWNENFATIKFKVVVDETISTTNKYRKLLPSDN